MYFLIFLGYISYVLENCSDILEESSDFNLHHVASRWKLSTNTVKISNEIAGEMLFGKSDLSQRGFKYLRSLLKESNVELPMYENVRKHNLALEVGEIKSIHQDKSQCNCFGYYTSVAETLQKIICTESLFKLFKFVPFEKQRKMFNHLKEQDPNLYSNIDFNLRTIFIRVTSDNFRSSARMPTEQSSFSILNIEELVNCPYGQFITSLWRGSESREMIENHLNIFFKEVEQLVKCGIEVCGEKFNVVCFFVADLCLVKDVIGQCQCTSIYGCFHCKLDINSWSSKERKIGLKKSVLEMNKNGLEAKKVLGEVNQREHPYFKKFQQSHFGQWVSR